MLPILTTSLIHFSWKGWENVLFELGSEKVNVYDRPMDGMFTRVSTATNFAAVYPGIWGSAFTILLQRLTGGESTAKEIEREMKERKGDGREELRKCNGTASSPGSFISRGLKEPANEILMAYVTCFQTKLVANSIALCTLPLTSKSCGNRAWWGGRGWIWWGWSNVSWRLAAAKAGGGLGQGFSRSKTFKRRGKPQGCRRTRLLVRSSAERDGHISCVENEGRQGWNRPQLHERPWTLCRTRY